MRKTLLDSDYLIAVQNNVANLIYLYIVLYNVTYVNVYIIYTKHNQQINDNFACTTPITNTLQFKISFKYRYQNDLYGNVESF